MNPYPSAQDELEARVRLARARMDQIALETAAARPPLRRRILMFLRDAAIILVHGTRIVITEIATSISVRLH